MSNRSRKIIGFNGMLVGKQAAAYVGLPVWTFMYWFHHPRKNNKLPHYRIGNRYFFKEEDLDMWIENHRTA